MATDDPTPTEKVGNLQDRIDHRSPLENLAYEYRSDLLGLVGLTGLVFVFFVAVVGPIISPYDPIDPNYSSILQGPSLVHPMGTDELGRDILTRLMMGTRYSLLIGIGSISLAGFVGLIVGSVAGFTDRNSLDEVLMRSMDVLISFPAIVLGIAVMGILGTSPVDLGFVEIPNTGKLILVIGLVYAPRFARVTRGAVLQEKNRDYVTLAALEGASNANILIKEIFVNILSPLLVLFSYRLGSAMIVAAGLGFIGIGVQPPTPSLGVMIAGGREYIISGQWWIVVFPGIMLAITIMAWNLIGDAVRDALDPNVSASYHN